MDHDISSSNRDGTKVVDDTDTDEGFEEGSTSFRDADKEVDVDGFEETNRSMRSEVMIWPYIGDNMDEYVSSENRDGNEVDAAKFGEGFKETNRSMRS